MSLYETLYPYQKNIVDKFKDRERYGLFLDMGLGKTLVSLAFTEVNKCTKVIVVSINSKATEDIDVKGSWMWWGARSDIKYNFYSKKIFKPTKKNPNNFTQETNDFLLLNFEGLYSRSNDKRVGFSLRKEINDFINTCKGHNVAIIIDESHKVKDASSNQSKAVSLIYKLCKVKAKKTYLYLGTGTPFTKDYMDLYAQLKLLGWDQNKETFKDLFCVRGNLRGLLGWQQPIVGFKNVELLYKLVHTFAITIKSEDVIELPDKIFVDHVQKETDSFKLLSYDKAPMLRIQKLLIERNLPFFMSEEFYGAMTPEEKNGYWGRLGLKNINNEWCYELSDGVISIGGVNDSLPYLGNNLASIYKEANYNSELEFLLDYYYLFEQNEEHDKAGNLLRQWYEFRKFNPKKKINNPFYKNYAYPNSDWEAQQKGVLWMRCRQMSIGFQGNEESSSWFDKSRLEMLEEFLTNNEDNYLIFTNYAPELIGVFNVCYKLGYNIDVYSGQIKSLDFYKKYEDQTEDERINNRKNVIIANTVSGSVGMNWQLYNKCILFSIPLFSQYEQGLKRIHRVGQKDTCIYHTFYQNNWLDNGMMKSLKNSSEYNNNMFEADLKRVNELMEEDEEDE